MSALSPSISLAMSFSSAESPHIRRCSPSLHICPLLAFGGSSGSGSSGISSGSPSMLHSPMSAASWTSNPNCDISMPPMPASSSASMASSHSDASPALLSARRYALTCSGVRSSTTTTGTSDSPSSRAALSLVCPAMTTPSGSTRMGFWKWNSWMLALTLGTLASLSLGLFS